MKHWFLIILSCRCFISTASLAAENRVLVYQRNGPTADGKAGFVHDNLAASAAAIQELGKANGFAVDVSTNPAVFSDANLKQYKALVFANSNNRAFDTDEQRAAFQKFTAAQGELTSALSRLMVVVERYPELKSDQNFRDLQAQLEGTENRITVARQRYIKSVQEYNTTVVQFPTNLTAMVFGFKEKPQFTVENEKEIAKPPKVDFGKSAAPAPAAIPLSPPNEYTTK